MRGANPVVAFTDAGCYIAYNDINDGNNSFYQLFSVLVPLTATCIG